MRAADQRPDRQTNRAPSPASAALTMRLIHGNDHPTVSGLAPLPGQTNYLIGRDARRWQTGITSYARVKYNAVYPGIDLVWHGDGQQLEHDFILAPQADPQRIRLGFAGARQPKIDAEGALVLPTDAGLVRLLKPVAWQEVEGRRKPVVCDYAIDRRGQVHFALGAYDRRRELVIDPVLLYASYLGGGALDQAQSVALDRENNIYITGQTLSADFPGASPVQPALGGFADAFVLKLNPSGSAVIYGTWLGGTNEENPTAITVDQSGNAFVVGYTVSADFPVTNNAFQKTRGSNTSDGFAAKLNPAGTALVYATYLGGSGTDTITDIALDDAGRAHVAGITESANLPANGFQPKRASSGLFKSTDRAANWMNSGQNLPTTTVLALAVDPTNSNIVYAGGFTGFYKSIDGGVQWQAAGENNSAPYFTRPSVIAIDPTNPQIIYVGAEFSLVKSTDGGSTFVSAGQDIFGSADVLFVYDVLIDPSRPMTLYAGTDSGGFKSTNGGASWTRLTSLGAGSFPAQRPRVNKFVFDPTTSATLYAATSNGVLKSTNSGTTWTAINNGLGFNGFGIEVATIVIDPSAPNTLYAAANVNGGGVYKTIDGGATWSASNTPLAVSALALDPSAPNTLYAATRFGVYKTTDGGATWSASNNGMPARAINALALDTRTPSNLFVGVSGGNDAFVAQLNLEGSALNWLSYLGGENSEDARGVALDAAGNVYVTGATNSANFPVASPLQATLAGGADAYLAKFNPTGAQLLYSTFFGGSNNDSARDVQLNSAGEIHIVGITSSLNLPLKNAALPAFGGGSSDAFVAKLNAAGTATIFSTYLGGSNSDNGYSLALDAAGNVYVAGDTASTNFPLVDSSQPQLGGAADAFVTKFGPNGGAPLYSTVIGGTNIDRAYGLTVDAGGNAFAVGITSSTNFPTVTPLSATLRATDAFLIKLGVETDLALTKTAARNPVQANSNFVYTLTVTNNGPSTATGVTVTDPLLAGATFVSATASQGSCANNANAVTCTLDNLAAHTQATITLTVTPTIAGTLTNTATVRANELDTVMANNQASVQTTISTQPSLFGRVTTSAGAPLSAITVNLTNSATGATLATQQTNAQGFYQFANLTAGGNYTVTPTNASYSFEPPARSFTNLTVDQAADFVATTCAYAISPTMQSFAANGGTGTITVMATPRCAWTAEPSASWIKITAGATGAGNGTVTFSVDPTTAPRNGRITVAGQNFAIYQSFDPCTAPRFTAQSYLGPSSATLLATSDLDGDGRLDLIAGPPFSGTGRLTILRGTSTGEFSSSQEIPLTSSPRALLVADINGDSKPDLLTLGNRPDVVVVYLNQGAMQGNLSFGQAMQYSTTPSLDGRNSPLTFYLTELNRDGKPDLVVVKDPFGNNSFEATALLNDGAGGFGAPIPISLRQEMRSAVVVGVADINGDGNGDLLAVRDNFPGAEALVFPGNGLGGFGTPVISSFEVPLTFTILGGISFSVFGDFNNDGKLDVAVAIAATSGESPNAITLLLGDGLGRFGAQMTTNLGTRIGSLVAGDFNGDAKLDLAAPGSNAVFLLFGDGAGKLAAPATVPYAPTSDPPTSLVTGDFNADGKSDLALANYSGGSLATFINRCGANAGVFITGRISDRFPQLPFAGVTVRLSGTQTAVTQTDAGGNFGFTGLPAGGTYTVTPERPGTQFLPASANFTNLLLDQRADFIGTRTVAIVSAAGYQPIVAPESIIAIFGVDLSNTTQAATSQPLPTNIAGTRVEVLGAPALPLFFVSPTQINALAPILPDGTTTTLMVTTGIDPTAPISTGPLRIERVAPSLFAADASGGGLAAALLLRVRADGSQSYEAVVTFDAMQNKLVPVPIDLSNPAEQVFLILYGTGFRNHNGLSNVTTKIGDQTVDTLYAGAQGALVGLDQLNVRLPATLAGRGLVEVALSVEGKMANALQVSIK